MFLMSNALLWKHDENFQPDIAAAIGKSKPKRFNCENNSTLCLILFSFEMARYYCSLPFGLSPTTIGYSVFFRFINLILTRF